MNHINLHSVLITGHDLVVAQQVVNGLSRRLAAIGRVWSSFILETEPEVGFDFPVSEPVGCIKCHLTRLSHQVTAQ